MSHLQIAYLADQADAIKTIAGWQFGEWGHLSPGDSVERRIRKLKGALNRDRIPMTLVALIGDEAVGTAGLVEYDLPHRPDLSPWMASVFVPPAHRKQGIGSALVRRVVKEAHHLGISPLFLFTWDQEPLYRSLGWQVKERTQLEDTQIAIMEIRPEDV